MYRLLVRLMLLAAQTVALPLSLPLGQNITRAQSQHINHLNSTQLNHLLWYTSYSGASKGMNIAVGAFNAAQWCAIDNIAWCPNAMNRTMFDIAFDTERSLNISRDDCDNTCLATSLCNVTTQATLAGMRWTAAVFETNNLTISANGTAVIQDHLSALQEPDRCVVDQPTFDNAMREQQSWNVTSAPAANQENNNQNVKSTPNSGNDGEEDDDDDDDYKKLLPALWVPAGILSPLTGFFTCNLDPTLCGSGVLSFLRGFFHAVEKVAEEPAKKGFKDIAGDRFARYLEAKYGRGTRLPTGPNTNPPRAGENNDIYFPDDYEQLPSLPDVPEGPDEPAYEPPQNQPPHKEPLPSSPADEPDEVWDDDPYYDADHQPSFSPSSQPSDPEEPGFEGEWWKWQNLEEREPFKLNWDPNAPIHGPDSPPLSPQEPPAEPPVDPSSAPPVEEPPKVETPKTEEPPKVQSPKTEEQPKVVDPPTTEEQPKVDTPTTEEQPKVDPPKAEEPKVETSEPQQPELKEEPKVEEPVNQPDSPVSPPKSSVGATKSPADVPETPVDDTDTNGEPFAPVPDLNPATAPERGSLFRWQGKRGGKSVEELLVLDEQPPQTDIERLHEKTKNRKFQEIDEKGKIKRVRWHDLAEKGMERLKGKAVREGDHYVRAVETATPPQSEDPQHHEEHEGPDEGENGEDQHNGPASDSTSTIEFADRDIPEHPDPNPVNEQDMPIDCVFACRDGSEPYKRDLTPCSLYERYIPIPGASEGGGKSKFYVLDLSGHKIGEKWRNLKSLVQLKGGSEMIDEENWRRVDYADEGTGEMSPEEQAAHSTKPADETEHHGIIGAEAE